MITMCQNKGCTISHRCVRAQMKPEPNQRYSIFIQGADEICKDLIPTPDDGWEDEMIDGGRDE